VKEFIKHNWIFYTCYLLILIWVGYFLLNFDKVSIHHTINARVGNVLADNFYKYITHVGDGIFAVILGLVVGFYNIRNGLYILFSYMVSGTISSFLKNYVFHDVNRPHWVLDEIMHEKYNRVEGVDVFIHNSFPSGHSTTAFAIFTSLALVSKNKFVKFVCLVLAVNAAFSRTYISQHWLVDIYVGSLLGLITATVLYFIFVQPGFAFFNKLNRPLYQKPG
jgi:membrane-associated phospholipid phosphatase